MREEDIKIALKENKIITLKELFERQSQARKEMAGLSFEEKIKILKSLQEIALHWGRRKDVIVWQ